MPSSCQVSSDSGWHECTRYLEKTARARSGYSATTMKRSAGWKQSIGSEVLDPIEVEEVAGRCSGAERLKGKALAQIAGVRGLDKSV